MPKTLVSCLTSSKKCAKFQGKTSQQIKDDINNKINKPLWKLRTYIAGKRKYPKKDFTQAQPNEDKRLLLAAKIDLAEMHQAQQFIWFENDDEVLAARLTFIDTPGIQILPKPKRFYPYKSAAAQIIGWVRPWNTSDEEIFNNDLARYMHGDIVGFSGVEYICEGLLRGKRGRIQYNIDKEVIDRIETQFGQNIQLTIDIELQKKIENRFQNKALNSLYWDKPASAVVIDVNSCEILAMVSLPNHDLNKARQNYDNIINDTNKPSLNRAINKNYPPGSIAKPLILLIGTQEEKINPQQTINCTGTPPPRRWPRCWYQKKYGFGHDSQWQYEGGNNARNTIRGSCNIYFSQLAVMIEPKKIQEWLWSLGLGHESLGLPGYISSIYGQKSNNRKFRQSPGIISSKAPPKDCETLSQLPKIENAERRFFGIGQGNFRVTPLQVANAFAAIARDGIYKKPQIFATDKNEQIDSTDLNLKPSIINTIREGMNAVVSEQGGTAARAFQNAGFEQKGITVFGKTGSTEEPYLAWFAGFAEDNKKNKIAISVLVEGGQHGSTDAAPIGRDIISFCIEEGYLKSNDQN